MNITQTRQADQAQAVLVTTAEAGQLVHISEHMHVPINRQLHAVLTAYLQPKSEGIKRETNKLIIM